MALRVAKLPQIIGLTSARFACFAFRLAMTASVRDFASLAALLFALLCYAGALEKMPKGPSRMTKHELTADTMYCVSWTYQMPAGYSAEQIRDLFARTADVYVGVPGLVRKYFGHSDDLRQVVGVYLWESKAHADAFYSPEWIAGVKSRWGSMPAKAEWIVPQVVESQEARVITSGGRKLQAAE